MTIKFNDITTTADLMSYDIVNDTDVMNQLIGGIIYSGLRELPSYDYDVSSEWFYSDLVSNIGCFMDNPFDYGLQCRSHNEDEVSWRDIEDLMNKPQIKQYLMDSIEDEFRKEATAFLEKRDWIVEHKMARS